MGLVWNRAVKSLYVKKCACLTTMVKKKVRGFL